MASDAIKRLFEQYRLHPQSRPNGDTYSALLDIAEAAQKAQAALKRNGFMVWELDAALTKLEASGHE